LSSTARPLRGGNDLISSGQPKRKREEGRRTSTIGGGGRKGGERGNSAYDHSAPKRTAKSTTIREGEEKRNLEKEKKVSFLKNATGRIALPSSKEKREIPLPD